MSQNPLLDVDPNDLISLVTTLVDIPSVSQEEKLICDYIEEYIHKIRPDVNIVRYENSFVVQVEYDSNSELPIIFAGHTDTVPPSENGDSARPSRIDGDLLYGLGSSDMKSGLAVMLKLLSHIKVKSTFIFYEGEEIEDEFNGLRKLADEKPELLIGKWAILLEPTDGQLELGCQGNLNANIIFKGVAAHSARPHLGKNAIFASVDTLAKIKDFSQSIQETEINNLLFKESLQITLIKGGQARNILPDSIAFNINYRYLPTKSVDEIRTFIQDLCCEADEVNILGIYPGAIPAYDHPLVEIAKSKGLSILPKVAWTDVARFFALGIPALNCGPGLVEMCHRADEHLSIKLLNSTYELLNELANS